MAEKFSRNKVYRRRDYLVAIIDSFFMSPREIASHISNIPNFGGYADFCVYLAKQNYHQYLVSRKNFLREGMTSQDYKI